MDHRLGLRAAEPSAPGGAGAVPGCRVEFGEFYIATQRLRARHDPECDRRLQMGRMGRVFTMKRRWVKWGCAGVALCCLAGCGSESEGDGKPGDTTADEGPDGPADDARDDAGCLDDECTTDDRGDARDDAGPSSPVVTPKPPVTSVKPGPSSPEPSTTVPDVGMGSGGMPGTEPSGDGGAVFAPNAPKQLDLLFVIDNSSSMGDKQALLRETIPDLIEMLANPPCVTQSREFVAYPKPGEVCPARAQRVFDPVTDVHIGIITSSLGPQGTIADEIPLGCSAVPGEDDRAWLLGRARQELNASTYQGWGFLAWDPSQVAQPPGEQDLGQLVADFQEHVSAVGESGCGFEAPLEAAYRFLIDPDPYETLTRVPCDDFASSERCVERVGTDDELLAQRTAFLRPDSVLGVVYLTDEDDCSVRVDGFGYLTMQSTALPGGTRACEDDPNSECCRPCDVAPPTGCETDPDLNGCNDSPADIPEARPLRCFDQQRRFGVSYLRSTDIYVGGFKNSMVAGRDNNARPNPLFTGARTPEDVFLVGIVGVPWQDTATAATREQASDLELSLGSELDWSLFLPTGSAAASDPFNRQSMSARQGTHPLTGETLGGVGTWNSINGHERALLPNDGFDDDLQFSCIFQLPEPRDCSSGMDPATCDCVVETDDGTEYDYANGNPVCLDPVTRLYGTMQHYARAYPAPRILEVLRSVSCTSTADCSDRAVVSSICPRQASDPAALDFGYRPAMRALLRSIASASTR